MATNPYVNYNSYSPQQETLSNLIEEAIKFYGNDVKFMPRTIVNEDQLFGEDPLGKFDDAITIEMYVKDVEGFQGQGDIFSKFGLDINDQLVLTVARKRFEQITTETLLSEGGYALRMETANTLSFASTDYWKREVSGYTLANSRPMEGDLIYFPLVNKVFEITFVEHESLFYSYGALLTYDLRCEVFEYSSERFDTGDSTIDAIETDNTQDVLGNVLQLEDSSTFVTEANVAIISENLRVEAVEPTANNEFYEAEADSIIDWSQTNPFGQVDRY